MLILRDERSVQNSQAESNSNTCKRRVPEGRSYGPSLRRGGKKKWLFEDG